MTLVLVVNGTRTGARDGPDCGARPATGDCTDSRTASRTDADSRYRPPLRVPSVIAPVSYHGGQFNAAGGVRIINRGLDAGLFLLRGN